MKAICEVINSHPGEVRNNVRSRVCKFLTKIGPEAISGDYDVTVWYWSEK